MIFWKSRQERRCPQRPRRLLCHVGELLQRVGAQHVGVEAEGSHRVGGVGGQRQALLRLRLLEHPVERLHLEVMALGGH